MVRAHCSYQAQFGIVVGALLVDGQHSQDAGSVAIGTIDKGLEAEH
jgi:hypothetical protein